VNVGLRALSQGAAWEIALRDRRGALRARRAGTLPAHGSLHAPAAEVVGESPRPGEVVLVSVMSGALFAWATPIGETGATFLLAETLPVAARFPLTWRQEPGLRIPNRPGREVLAPETVVLPGGRLRMYFNVMTRGVASALSDDGLAFTDEPGLRLTSQRVPGALDFDVGHCWLIELPDGGFRMFYGSNSGIDTPARMKSAVSSDLLSFRDEGLVFDVGPSSGLSFAGHGRAARQPDGTYLMLFSGNFIGENDREPSDVIRAVSRDGLSWSVADRHLFLRGHDPALVRLADGKLAAVFSYLKESLRASTSADGVTWSEAEDLVLLDEAGAPVPEIHGDVCLVRMPDGRLRMYSNGPAGITSFVPAE
jgi:hypothetical protein